LEHSKARQDDQDKKPSAFLKTAMMKGKKENLIWIDE
jgi:hypothetical protein